MRSTPDGPTKGDKLIARWQQQNPDAEPFSVDRPTPYFTVRGKKYSMTGEQYEQFQREAGELANTLVEKALPDVEKPSEAIMKRMKSLILKARAQTRKRLLPQWASDQS